MKIKVPKTLFIWIVIYKSFWDLISLLWSSFTSGILKLRLILIIFGKLQFVEVHKLISNPH